MGAERAEVEPARYDAFVSYRHLEPDRRWARWLHAGLERYRVPQRLVREKGVPRRLSRVFRDEDEVPASSDLATEIETALERSRFLVVVCSRRTPESKWIDREVRAFREMGRDGRILALLVDGEPSESFPPSLREVRRRVVAASGEERLEEVEPLAADVRPRRGESARSLRRAALLRILASVLGCAYDDLRRREQERTTRRVAAVAAGLLVLAAGAGALAAFALRERARAEASEGESRAALARNLTEQGRVESLAGRPGRALAWLAESVRVDPRPDPVRDLLAARAAASMSAHVGTFRTASRAAVRVVASPDGARAAVVGLDDLSTARRGVVEVFEVATARRVCALEGPTRWVEVAAFSPDGLRVATACDDGVARIHDAATGKVMLSFDHRGFAETDADREVKAVAWRADGARIVTACNDGNARVWDARTGALVATLPGHAKEVGGTRFLDEGRVAGPGAASLLRTWDAEDGRVLSDRGTEKGIWLAPVWSGDGRKAAVVDDDADAKLLDAATGATTSLGERAPIALDGSAERALVLRGDGALLLARPGGDENAVELAEAPAGASARGAFSPDGARVAGVVGHTVRVWETDRGAPLAVLDGHSDLVVSVAWTPDGSALLSASEDGTVAVWRPGSAERPRALEGFLLGDTEPFSPDGGRLLVSHARLELVPLDGGAPEVVPSPDGAYAARWEDGRVRLHVRRREDPGLAVPARAPHTGRPWLLLEMDYDAVGVVDVDTGETRGRLEGHGDRVLTAAFDPARRRVVTACQDGHLRVFRVDGTPLASWKLTARGLTCAEFSRDGRRIAVGAQDDTVRVVDADSGRVLVVADGEPAVHALAWSPDDAFLATLSSPHDVRVREARTGLLLGRARGVPSHAGRVHWSADGRHLAWGDPQFGTVHVLDVPGAVPAARLEALVNGHAAWRVLDGRLVPREAATPR